MLQGIDHIVFGVSDLDSAIQNFTEQGYTVVPGGKHTKGTHNALIGFEDGSYIEIIAFFEQDKDHRWWNPIQHGGGWIDFCMQTDDVRGDTAKFQQAGVDMQNPVPLGRVRPDGYQLNWVNTRIQGGYQSIIPFLIEDQTPREERVPKETTHTNQTTGIETLTLIVEDQSTIQAIYAHVLQHKGKVIERDDLDATGIRFNIGSHTLDYLTPKHMDSPLSAQLQSQRNSIYSATFIMKSGESLSIYNP